MFGLRSNEPPPKSPSGAAHRSVQRRRQSSMCPCSSRTARPIRSLMGLRSRPRDTRSGRKHPELHKCGRLAIDLDADRKSPLRARLAGGTGEHRGLTETSSVGDAATFTRRSTLRTRRSCLKRRWFRASGDARHAGADLNARRQANSAVNNGHNRFPAARPLPAQHRDAEPYGAGLEQIGIVQPGKRRHRRGRDRVCGGRCRRQRTRTRTRRRRLAMRLSALALRGGRDGEGERHNDARHG